MVDCAGFENWEDNRDEIVCTETVTTHIRSKLTPINDRSLQCFRGENRHLDLASMLVFVVLA